MSQKFHLGYQVQKTTKFFPFYKFSREECHKILGKILFLGDKYKKCMFQKINLKIHKFISSGKKVIITLSIWLD